MKRTVSIIVVSLLLSFWAVFARGGERGAPDWALAAAVDCLVDRVGEEFFKTTMGYKATDKLQGGRGYWVYFELRLEDKPWVRPDVIVKVDTLGNCRESVLWLPDLRRDPNACVFCISPDDAKRIAKEAGLKSGIAEWVVVPVMRDGAPFWSVQNRTGGEQGRWWGWAVEVNQHTGEVRAKRFYYAQP